MCPIKLYLNWIYSSNKSIVILMIHVLNQQVLEQFASYYKIKAMQTFFYKDFPFMSNLVNTPTSEFHVKFTRSIILERLKTNFLKSDQPEFAYWFCSFLHPVTLENYPLSARVPLSKNMLCILKTTFLIVVSFIFNFLDNYNSVK